MSSSSATSPQLHPHSEARHRIIEGDALAVMRGMPDNSIDAIVTDPPYFKVKGVAWDMQWDKPDAFLAWIGQLCEQWQRILRPNGSLYCFASPKMAWGVEGEIRKRFNVLNRIRWAKPTGRSRHQCKEALRSFFPDCEEIIFAEHFGADNIAKGEAGYEAKCDELRGFVFEPLRAYLRGEFDRAGVHTDRANEFCGTASMAGRHYFTRSQWCLPTAHHYAALQRGLNAQGGEYLRRDYEYLRRDYEDLRREYEDLRREYEDLRRPFNVTPHCSYTDTWRFRTVPHRTGKHICEKPLPLLRQIISASTRPDAVVLDCFAGSASTGAVCFEQGRQFIGIEIDPEWVKRGRERIASLYRDGVQASLFSAP